MKKKYTLPTNISSEISTTIELVQNNIGSLNYNIVPIDAIEFDPENPRKLAILRSDLPQGPSHEDPLYSKKIREFRLLQQMAETIKKYGVRNAVEIYKHGSGYRLIHGERRCLSSILAERKEIPAKILNGKPNDFDIKLLQLIENVQREDLTLHEVLNNIRQVIDQYKYHVNSSVKIDSVFLENLINRSKTHCLNFLAVLNAPDDLKKLIEYGDIKSLEKAAIIAKSKTDSDMKFLLKSCLSGASLKELKKQSLQQKNTNSIQVSMIAKEKKRPGKQASNINLGSTKNKHVVSKLIKLVSCDKPYLKFKQEFEQFKLNDYGDFSSAFSNLIKIMEKIEV